MKEGKKEEAEAAKSRVAELKEVNKDLQAEYGAGCQRLADSTLHHPQRSL